MATGARRLWLVFAGLPLATAAVLWLTEVTLMNQPGADVALDGQIPATVGKVLELNAGLADLFIKLATAVVGAVAYYVRIVREGKSRFSRVGTACAIAAILAAVASIFFGHLWLAGMRNQLANDYFNQRAPELLWPERLQYFAFLSALAWFGLLGFHQERGTLAGAEVPDASGVRMPGARPG